MIRAGRLHNVKIGFMAFQTEELLGDLEPVRAVKKTFIDKKFKIEDLAFRMGSYKPGA